MKVKVEGVPFDRLTEAEVVDTVFQRLASDEGGYILTPNVDVLRQLKQHRAHDLVERSALVVPDGMPIVWASRLMGTPLPERVTGASLVWSLSEGAAARGASIFLLGGAPGVAEQAATAFEERFPSLNIAGIHCPPVGFEHDDEAVGQVRDAIADARPDVVFVALGHPKQDRLGDALLEQFPGTWFLGCGGALTMAADVVPRAPHWLSAFGLEWFHRFLHEPSRLFTRYFVHDMPFAARLLARALGHGVRDSLVSLPEHRMRSAMSDQDELRSRSAAATVPEQRKSA